MCVFDNDSFRKVTMSGGVGGVKTRRESIMFLKHKDITYRIIREDVAKKMKWGKKKPKKEDKAVANKIYLYIHREGVYGKKGRGYYKTSTGGGLEGRTD